MSRFHLLILVLFTKISFILTTYQTILIESLTSSQGITIKGTPQNGILGNAISIAGDFNGDGIDDFLVADCYYLGETGVVYVLFGRSEGLENMTPTDGLTPSQGFLIKGPSAKTRFGAAVCNLGDVNGDGIDDIMIVASIPGQIYVVYGRRGEAQDIFISSGFTSDQGFLLHSSDVTMNAVPNVKGAGDVNGDGIKDMLIGIPQYASNTGIVYIIYGSKNNPSLIELSTSLDPSQGFLIQGPGSGSSFATRLYPAGDINGDKIDDFIISATGTSTGSVYFLYGKSSKQIGWTIGSSLSPSDGYVVLGASAGSSFGAPVSIGGDINGDGFIDMVVGASQQNGGTAYILSGAENGFSGVSLTTSGRVSAVTASQSTMKCVSSFGIGDMNGDDLTDLAFRCTPIVSGSAATTVYVVFGSVVGVPTETLPDALDSGSSFGFAVSSQEVSNALSIQGSGDFNNDYLEDLLLYGNPSTSPKAIYVIYGSNGCPKNCSQCSSSTVCLVCFGGLGVYKSECVNCPKGTFVSGPNCIDCPMGCAECESETICSSCAADYLLINSQCVSKGKSLQENITGAALDGASALGNSVAIGSSLPTNFGLVAKILRNIRYLNVTVSDELNEVFTSWKISSGFVDYPESWGDESDSGSLPTVFARYNVGALFLINYWKSFVMILIGMALFAPFKLLEITQCSKKSKLGSIFRLLNIIASNFTLTQLYGSLDDIIFYFILQVRENNFQTSFQKANLAVSIILSLFAILAFLIHLFIIKRYQSSKRSEKRSEQQLQSFLQKYENFKMLFQDFKDSGLLKQSFLMIYIVRSIISGLLVTNLFDYPLLQTLLLTSLNILIFVYLIVEKPFKEALNMWGQYFCETVLLFVNVSMLGMAFIAEMVEENQGAIEIFSKIVIIANMVLVVGSLVFMALSVIKALYVAYKTKQGEKKLQEKMQVKIKGRRMNESLDQSACDQLNLSKSQIVTDFKVTHMGVLHNSQQIQDDPSTISMSFQKLSFVRAPAQRLAAKPEQQYPNNLLIYDPHHQQEPAFGDISPIRISGGDHISRSRPRQNSNLKRALKRSSKQNSPSPSQKNDNQVSYQSRRSPLGPQGESPGQAILEKNHKIPDSNSSVNSPETFRVSKFHAQQRFVEVKINQEMTQPAIEEQPKKYLEAQKEDPKAWQAAKRDSSGNISYLEESTVIASNQERDYEKFLRKRVNESSAAYIKQRWLEKFQQNSH